MAIKPISSRGFRKAGSLQNRQWTAIIQQRRISPGYWILNPVAINLSAGRINFDGVVYPENAIVKEAAGILTYGQYQNIVLHSEDTDNWTGTGPWTQSINITELGIYTISTEDDGATVNVIAGTATIAGVEPAIYDSPGRFEITGIGTVTIITDVDNPKVQITDTPYKMPYVKTGDFPSDVESLPDNPSSITSELTAYDPQTGVYTIDTPTGAWAVIKWDDTLTIEKKYRLTYTEISNTDGYPKIGEGYAGEYGLNEGSEVVDFVAVDTSLSISRAATDGTVCSFKLSVHEFVPATATIPSNNSNADEGYKTPIEGKLLLSLNGTDGTDTQGEWQVEWTPHFSYSDTTINGAIISQRDFGGAGALLYHRTDGELRLYDTYNTVNIDVNYQADTTYIIKMIYGTHPVSGIDKMQIMVEDKSGATGPWQSAVVDFDGSFNPGTDLSLAWENEYPQSFGPIKIYKEPQSW